MYIIPFFFFSSVVCVEAQVLCIYCWSICCVRTGIDVAGRVGPELVPENENEFELAFELQYVGKSTPQKNRLPQSAVTVAPQRLYCQDQRIH